MDDRSAPSPSDLAGKHDHGCLPAWNVGDLPEPPPFSARGILRTIGPGAILLVGSIGGGEWVVGPMTAAQYGRGILWLATVAIVLQAIFNLEAVRYAIYSGEPILTGIMRLRPGPKLWGPLYIALAVAQLGAPALAAAAANVLFAAFTQRMPGDEDQFVRVWLTLLIIVTGVVLLLSGRKVERTLERLSWFMVSFILVFLVAVNIAFVPFAEWGKTFGGFFQFGYWPSEMNLMLISAFAATAGSGGLGNLAISNWFRDKGFGMGKHVGGIGGLLAHGEEVKLAPVGRVFLPTSDNLRRWATWWRHALVDQNMLWAFGCVLGMFLNVNLVVYMLRGGELPSEHAMGVFQAEYLSRTLSVLWPLTLLNGFWILFSTHLGNTDILVRTVSDTLWAGFPRTQMLSPSRIYALLLALFSVFGGLAINLGTAMFLFQILGSVAGIVTALAAVQILIVNRRFLPQEIQPALWRQLGLAACALFYGVIAVALIFRMLSSLGSGA